MGLSASAVGALAGACGDEGDGRPTRRRLPPMDETTPAEIVFYNWTDYFNPGAQEGVPEGDGHQDQGGLLLVATRSCSPSSRPGPRATTSSCPSDYMVHIMIKSGIAGAARHGRTCRTSSTSASSSRRRPSTIPDENNGMKYSVPYFYGTTGYCQRTDKVAEPQTDVGSALGRAVQGQDQPARRRARVPGHGASRSSATRPTPWSSPSSTRRRRSSSTRSRSWRPTTRST